MAQRWPLPIQGAYYILLPRYGDERGYMQESFRTDTKLDLSDTVEGQPSHQIAWSKSCKGVLRGFHTSPYYKAVSILSGSILDVLVDLRPHSPTYLKYAFMNLSEEEPGEVIVPPGVGHGFLSRSDDTRMLYVQGGVYKPEQEVNVRWNDAVLNVPWPKEEAETALVSAKDSTSALLSEARPDTATLEPGRRISLVIGASGQVGGALCELLTDARCVGTYCANAAPRPGCVPFDMDAAADNPKLAEQLLSFVRPAVVYICAGFTWVDGCERDVEKAQRLNHRGPLAVAQAAKVYGAKVVFYSTDYVFDGRAASMTDDAAGYANGYVETAPLNPLNVYGKSKVDGETAILQCDPSALILRTTVVYGPEMQGKNFVYQLARRLADASGMSVPNDQVGSPTYNRDLAAISAELVEKGATGIYNVVGEEIMDRYAFAVEVASALGLDSSTVKGTETVAGAAQTFGKADAQVGAERPLRCGLSMEKTLAVVSHRPRSVRNAIAHWKATPFAAGAKELGS